MKIYTIYYEYGPDGTLSGTHNEAFRTKTQALDCALLMAKESQVDYANGGTFVRYQIDDDSVTLLSESNYALESFTVREIDLL